MIFPIMSQIPTSKQYFYLLKGKTNGDPDSNKR